MFVANLHLSLYVCNYLKDKRKKNVIILAKDFIVDLHQYTLHLVDTIKNLALIGLSLASRTCKAIDDFQ